MIEELDGVLRAGTVPTSRLKKFVSRPIQPENPYIARTQDEGILERVYGPIPGGLGENRVAEEAENDSETDVIEDLNDRIVTRYERQKRAEEEEKERRRTHIPRGKRFAVVLNPYIPEDPG